MSSLIQSCCIGTSGHKEFIRIEFIRIEQPDRIITGHGFESNQQMTVYTIRKPEGIFYVDEETAAADSLQTDTIN